MELWTDGSRRATWSTTLHDGVVSWDAAADLDRYVVSFTDGSTYRCEQVEGAARATVTDWDGRTVVTNDVDTGPRLADVVRDGAGPASP